MDLVLVFVGRMNIVPLPTRGQIYLGLRAGAAWSEIDGGAWTIPAERMKAQSEHRVPLSPQALAVLEQARSIPRTPRGRRRSRVPERSGTPALGQHDQQAPAHALRGRGAARVSQQLPRLGVGMHRCAPRRDGGGARVSPMTASSSKQGTTTDRRAPAAKRAGGGESRAVRSSIVGRRGQLSLDPFAQFALQRPLATRGRLPYCRLSLSIVVARVRNTTSNVARFLRSPASISSLYTCRAGFLTCPMAQRPWFAGWRGRSGTSAAFPTRCRRTTTASGAMAEHNATAKYL